MKLLSLLAVTAVSASGADGSNPEPAAKAVNEFGIELHQRLSGGGDANLCVSPYSIQSALAMTFAGSEGATREEMAKVLHFPAGDEIHGSFASLQASLKKLTERTVKSVKSAKDAEGSGGPSEPLTLNVANRLFGQKGYGFKSPFQTLLKTTYGAALEELDFLAAPEPARKHINGWVEDQTRKRIRDLIPAGAITKETGLVLANAVYLKAPWAEEFSIKATKPEPFHIKGGKPSSVPTMIRQAQFGYAKRDGYIAVSIPYTGGDVHFLVLLPDDVNGLAVLEKQLNADGLAAGAKLEPQDVILHLPKFRMEPPTIALGKELRTMGLKTAFNIPEGSANFERMAPRRPDDYLYISEVFHKTFIALDEKGTEAAAATAVVMFRATAAPAEPAKPVEVKVDRPFLYAIQHKPSGACLFLGRVADPR